MLELSTNLLVDLGGWPAMKEARTLVQRGLVREAARDGAIIRGKVQAAEKVHEPRITLAERAANVEVHCTCIESRRHGRVCSHALAVGLAVMEGKLTRPAATPKAAISHGPRLQRKLVDDAPPEIPRIEFSVLLPLQLKDALAKDPVRVILEARRENDALPQPFDTIIRDRTETISVSEEDDHLLTALESLTGAANGLNAIPRGKISAFLHALGNHPRVWIGKKQRIGVRAAEERAPIIINRRDDGALELRHDCRPQVRRLPAEPLLPNWNFDGITLTESPALAAGFTDGTRIIPAAQIPDFLSRELPVLERTCELIFAPGLEEFRLEIGEPEIEARLDGALSGLTLDLIAHYGREEFPLYDKTEPSVYQRYFPASASPAEGRDGRTEERNKKRLEPQSSPKHSVYSVIPSSFWRRNILAERKALAEIEAAGFARVRSGAAAYSLISENHVARFLANTLPRWRREWKITLRPRLESTMEQVDIAQPEFSFRPGGGNDWLGLDLKLAVEGKPIPLDAAEVQRWLQTGQSHARTANKRVLLVPTEAWREMQEVLADCEVEQEPGAMRVGKKFAPYLSGALRAEGFRDMGEVHALTNTATAEKTLDPKLWAQLRPYQAKGVEWLARLAQENLHGLLADEMGLGKTLQALAFAAWLKAEVSHGGRGEHGGKAGEQDTTTNSPPSVSSASSVRNLPILIICPTSLVTNWLREAARFTPWLRALDLTGSDRAEKFSRAHEYDLLVTSYAILRRDIEAYRAMDFSLVILDEAQHIKNRASQNALAAKALRARHRLVLTCTPLENSVLDLWSLFDFLAPGYLGTAPEFKERYETPLTKAPEPKLMQRLRHRVKPFFLRRTKAEVLTDLPAKLDFPALVELSAEQRAVYREILAQGRREVFEHSDKEGRKSGRDRLAVLTALLRLRQVCCHLDLLPTEATELRRQVRSQMEFGNEGTGTSRWREPSAKMDRTFELIDEAIDGGHRVLFFSQFVRVLHLLCNEAKHRDVRFCYLDGQTTERQTEVDRFQNDAGIPLFLISLKAGGTGLNLTGADTVIHFDPLWNPAVEEQATARAHRIGQSRRVSAYKLIAAGTVEEKIQQLQSRKRDLFEASLGSDEAFVEKLSGDEIEELLAD